MSSSMWWILGAAVLCGCATLNTPLVTADLTYSNAGGFGTQNAGDFRPGAMFIWNTATNEMQFVDTLPLSPVASDQWPSTRLSNRVSGLGVTGLPTNLLGQEALVSASVAGQSRFSVTEGFRENYRNVRTELTNYVIQMMDDGDDPDLLFRPRENEYRVVVVHSVLRAMDSNLAIGGVDASNPSEIANIALNSPIGEVTSVSVRSGTNTRCSAPEGVPAIERPVCFFNVVVYRPTYLPDNPRLQWENAPFPQDTLPIAFRGLR